MRIVPSGRMLLAAGLALALAPAARPAPAPAETRSKAATPVDRLRQELDRKITLDLDQQPLALAVNQLHEQTKINFVLDRFTLAQNGIDPDQVTVSLKLKDVKVRTALRSLLTPYNLNFAILGDTVLVSTDEAAMARQLRQRVSVNLEKVELARALKELARDTGTNLVVDTRVAKDAQAALTVQMEDVPLETAVRLMAEMANLKPVRVGNTLFVTSKTTAAELRNDPDLQPAPMPGGNPGTPGVVIGAAAGPAAGAPVAPVVVPVPGAAPPAPMAPGGGKPAEEKADKPDKPEKPADKPAPPEDRPAKPS